MPEHVFSFNAPFRFLTLLSDETKQTFPFFLRLFFLRVSLV